MATSRAICMRVMGTIWLSGSILQWPLRICACWAWNAAPSSSVSASAACMALRMRSRGKLLPSTVPGIPGRRRVGCGWWCLVRPFPPPPQQVPRAAPGRRSHRGEYAGVAVRRVVRPVTGHRRAVGHPVGWPGRGKRLVGECQGSHTRRSARRRTAKRQAGAGPSPSCHLDPVCRVVNAPLPGFAPARRIAPVFLPLLPGWGC